MPCGSSRRKQKERVSMSSSDPPDFIARSDLLERAYRFALDAHEGERSRGKTRIDHPIAGRRLGCGAGKDR
jgi:hypothetical protein